MINVLVRLTHREAALQLQKQPAQKARLLAAPNKRRPRHNAAILLIKLYQLHLGVRRGRGLTQLLVPPRQLLAAQLRGRAEAAHAQCLWAARQVLHHLADIDALEAGRGTLVERRQSRHALHLHGRKQRRELSCGEHQRVAGRLVAAQLLNHLHEAAPGGRGLEAALEAARAAEAVAGVEEAVELAGDAGWVGVAGDARAEVVDLLQGGVGVVGRGGRGEGVGELVGERAAAAREAVEEVGVHFGLLEGEHVGPDGGFDVGFGVFWSVLAGSVQR